MSRKVNLFRAPTICQDADVQAFMTATGITDPVIDRAICDFVAYLKANSLWTLLDAIYPFVGGTATTHKFNLKNPADTNAAFRLSFSGGWTHAATGATPNGVNAFANTFFNPSVNAAITRHSFGIYSRTEDVAGTKAYGATNGSNFSTHSPSAGSFLIGSGAGPAISYTPSPTTRFMMIRSTASNFRQAYRDGVSLGSNSAASVVTMPNLNFYFGARNLNNVAQLFTTYELAFAFTTGQVLTDTNALNLTTAVNALQLALSRNV
jgi:hypothetical protein